MTCCACIGTWLVGLATVVLALYAFLRYKLTYWDRKGFPQLEPVVPYGNAKGMGSKYNLNDIMTRAYNTYKEAQVVGMYMFTTPILVVRDLELVKAVLIKDFNSFADRGFETNTETDPLTGHLFFLTGKKWKNMRIKLTPTFTSGKIKMMFPTIIKCGDGLKNALQKHATEGNLCDVKNTLSCYTTDVIATCVFGLQVNAFENPDTEFRRMTDFLFRPTMKQGLSRIASFVIPSLFKYLNVKVVPEQVDKFFIEAVKDTFKQRKEYGIKRNDFIQLLLQLVEKGQLEDTEQLKHGAQETNEPDYDPTFTEIEAAAQGFSFFVAGFETASTTMQFCLYELAKNHTIQEKLREDIDKVLAKYNGEITYEGVQEMEYLDKVVSETLRKHPPTPLIARICTKAFRIPDSDLVIERGRRLMISTSAIQHDPKHYPNPDVFDPERFSAEEKAKRHPMTYLPFGDGPRNCIGSRFSLIQVKSGLVLFLSKFKVDLAPETPKVLEYNPRTFLTTIKGELLLRVLPRPS